MKQIQSNELSNQLFESPFARVVGELKKYTAPEIEIVILDNEISLALQSAPPTGPGETQNFIQLDSYTNNPYLS